MSHFLFCLHLGEHVSCFGARVMKLGLLGGAHILSKLWHGLVYKLMYCIKMNN